jgi:hypothetical protein
MCLPRRALRLNEMKEGPASMQPTYHLAPPPFHTRKRPRSGHMIFAMLIANFGLKHSPLVLGRDA